MTQQTNPQLGASYGTRTQGREAFKLQKVHVTEMLSPQPASPDLVVVQAGPVPSFDLSVRSSLEDRLRRVDVCCELLKHASG